MNTFKKKSLYAALAGVSALGVTGAAQAVNVNPDGLGQALIYPYYTVRSVNGNAFNSLLSVVNSTASAKAVKVRFLEGKNSREVLDFNLYLSAKDVWTAAVLPTANAAGVATFDKSCTTPPVSNNPAAPTEFVNYAYVGDKGGDGLDRTREGYIEIIEMGDIIDDTPTYNAITHVNGVPPGCDEINDADASNDTVLGAGGLFGGVTLINVANGTDYTADAVALEAFNLGGSLWAPPGSILPDLTQANPPIATVFTNSTSATFAFNNGTDAVSAALMHDRIMNEFVLDSGTKSGTDWVVTFPTKRYYVFTGSGAANRPFQRNFASNGTGACDDIGLAIFDREERTVSNPQNFSPPPPTPVASLCWEANVITFNAANSSTSNVFGSTNVANIATSFQNGWLDVNFTQSASGAVAAHRLVSNEGATFNGLPVVGFAVQSFNNGNIGGVASNYGGNFVHKATRSITGLLTAQ